MRPTEPWGGVGNLMSSEQVEYIPKGTQGCNKYFLRREKKWGHKNEEADQFWYSENV